VGHADLCLIEPGLANAVPRDAGQPVASMQGLYVLGQNSSKHNPYFIG